MSELQQERQGIINVNITDFIISSEQRRATSDIHTTKMMIITPSRNVSCTSASTSSPNLVGGTGIETERISSSSSSTDNESLPPSSIVAMPVRRPLSSYNIFFQLERIRMINSESEQDHDYTLQEAMDFVDRQRVIRNLPQPKRLHRKTHGKLGFREMAQTLANKWKNLNPDMKRVFEECALIEKKRYYIEKKAAEASGGNGGMKVSPEQRPRPTTKKGIQRVSPIEEGHQQEPSVVVKEYKSKPENINTKTRDETIITQVPMFIHTNNSSDNEDDEDTIGNDSHLHLHQQQLQQQQQLHHQTVATNDNNDRFLSDHEMKEAIEELMRNSKMIAWQREKLRQMEKHMKRCMAMQQQQQQLQQLLLSSKTTSSTNPLLFGNQMMMQQQMLQQHGGSVGNSATSNNRRSTYLPRTSSPSGGGNPFTMLQQQQQQQTNPYQQMMMQMMMASSSPSKTEPFRSPTSSSHSPFTTTTNMIMSKKQKKEQQQAINVDDDDEDEDDDNMEEMNNSDDHHEEELAVDCGGGNGTTNETVTTANSTTVNDDEINNAADTRKAYEIANDAYIGYSQMIAAANSYVHPSSASFQNFLKKKFNNE